MENSRNRGDSVCKEITEQIRSRINPNSRDLADLKAAADENHEEAVLLLNSFGIQQDGDTYFLTNPDGALATLQRRRRSRRQLKSQNVDLKEFGGGQLAEMDRSFVQDEQCNYLEKKENGESAINVQPNGTSAVRRLSKKLHKGVKNIFGKKSAREEGNN